MNYQTLTDTELKNSLHQAVLEERKITINVLHLLREVERREIFAEMGYSSLFTYCVEHLKYSESAAQRKIVSMRALRELPELEEKIESGRLSLSVVALTQSSTRKMSLQKKREVFEQMEGLSRRKAEEVLLEKFDLEPSRQTVGEHPTVGGGMRLTFELSADENKEFEELRRLKSQSQNTKELILSLIRTEVAKRKRAMGEAPLLKRKSTAAGVSQLAGRQIGRCEVAGAEMRRDVWTRAKGQCEFQGENGRCAARHGLEFDHVQPLALGGRDAIENLRLLCRAHHRLITTKVFSHKHLQQFRTTLRS